MNITTFIHYQSFNMFTSLFLSLTTKKYITVPLGFTCVNLREKTTKIYSIALRILLKI